MTSVFAFWISLILVAGTCDHSETIVASAKVPPLRYRVARTHTHVFDQSVCGWYNEAVLFFAVIGVGVRPWEFQLIHHFGTVRLSHSAANMLLLEILPGLGFSRQCGAHHQQQNQAKHTDLHDDASGERYKQPSEQAAQTKMICLVLFVCFFSF